jgi:hypothetical protein
MAQIPCPQCGRLARIVDRFTLSATGGPVEHLKLSCPGGHVLTPLVEDLWPRRLRLERAVRVERAEPADEQRFARRA